MAEHWQRVIRTDPAIFERFRSAEDPGDVATRALVGRIPLEGRRVLEVGCGTGALTSLLTPSSGRVVALDRAPAAARRVDRSSPNLSVLVADTLAPPLLPGVIDHVVGGWIFAYLPAGRLLQCLRGLATRMSPSSEGALWAIENHWQSELQIMRERGGSVEQSEVQGLLDVGFEVVGEEDSRIEFSSVAEAESVLGALVGDLAMNDLARNPRSSFSHRLVLLRCPLSVVG